MGGFVARADLPAEVLAFVRATRGAIGYVSAGSETVGVKVLAVQ